MKQFYFMAGLPRSGSTLLSSILNQNPRIYSGPSSPVLPTMLGIENQFLNGELYKGYPKPNQANLIISSIIHQFYSDIEKPIVIDKNRAWPDYIIKLEGYICKPAKIICPVRDIDEILTSMIMMIRRNPYKDGQQKINFIDEQLIKNNTPLTDDNRCQFMAGPNGILGQSYTSIQKALNGGFEDRIHFVEYKDLVDSPEETLSKLYEFIGEEYYEHTFNNLENKNRENDLKTYGLSDMHEVHSELKSTAPSPLDVLSETILDKCKGMEFWRNLDK